MSRSSRRQQKAVNNVAPTKAAQGKAEGTATISGGSNRWTSPSITTDTIRSIEENALLKEPLNNLVNLIFRGEAQVTVYGPDGETDDALSAEAVKRYRDLDLYTAHQQAFYDICLGGCAVFSMGYDEAAGKEVFLHMPWWSFCDQPTGFTDVYNEIMPGIVVDPGTRKTRVFQKQSASGTPIEIVNHSIVRDPIGPAPAGRPLCMPVVPIILNYNYGVKVIQQKLNRVGSPIIIPLADINQKNKDLWENFAKKWGKDTAFVLPTSTEFADLKITDNRVAEEWVNYLRKVATDFWNPATFIQKDGNSIGGSDSGAMELVYNFIDRTLSMLENQICRETMDTWLAAGGYTERRYTVEIRHVRPSVKKDSQILAEVGELAKNGAITVNEMRQALPNTDLGELTPEQEAQLQEQARARQPAAFSPIPIGNVQTPAQRTDVMSDTERALIEATRKCAADVKRIALKDYPHKGE